MMASVPRLSTIVVVPRISWNSGADELKEYGTLISDDPAGSLNDFDVPATETHNTAGALRFAVM